MISVIQSEADDIVLNAEEAGKIFGIGASGMYKKAKRKQVPHHYIKSLNYIANIAIIMEISLYLYPILG